MTKHTPISGADTGLPAIERIEAIRERMAAFCTRFEVEPCKLTVRKGATYLTDSLHQWFITTGASIDWIISGDPAPMAASYRENNLKEREFQELIGKFDKEEHKLFIAAVNGWKAAVEAHRAQLRADAAGEAERG